MYYVITFSTDLGGAFKTKIDKFGNLDKAIFFASQGNNVLTYANAAEARNYHRTHKVLFEYKRRILKEWLEQEINAGTPRYPNNENDATHIFLQKYGNQISF